MAVWTRIVLMLSKRFFSEYRLKIGHMGYEEGKKGSDGKRSKGYNPPLWKDKKEWEDQGSSKYHFIVKLTASLLNSDKEPFPEWVQDGDEEHEGHMEWYEVERKKDGSAEGKVVIYCEFIRPIRHLIQVRTFSCFLVWCHYSNT